jgi:hypothetical protein
VSMGSLEMNELHASTRFGHARARSPRLRGRGHWVIAGALCLASACAVTATTALAQPSDAVTEVARQRYKDGVKAYDAGSYDEARQAFLQAYQLKKLPVMLLNLGQSELKSNHVADGGNHLVQFLHEYKDAKPEEVASANAGIDDAKHRVGQIAVGVSQPGAEVSIDGVVVGKSPMTDPVFAEPGTRTITATLNGTSSSTKVDVTKGQTTAATVTLGGSAPAPPPGPPPASNNEVPPPVAPAPPPGEFSPGTPQAIEPAPNQGEPSDHEEGFGKWYGHHPVAWLGTAFAGVGLALGIGFSAAAGAQASNANAIADAIRSQEGNNKNPPCSQDGASDRKGFGVACSSLRDSLSQNKTDNIVGGVGWGVFGVAAATTVIYILVEYPKRNSGSASVEVLPIVGPGYGGIGGRF